MKSTVNQAWYNTFGETTVQIYHRIVKTKSGDRTLKYFDSAVMEKYQIPPKLIEDVHCQSSARSNYCQSLEKIKYKNDIPIAKLDVRLSTVGEGSGRGLFSTTRIRKGDTIGYVSSFHPVYIPPITNEMVLNYADYGSDIDAIWSYYEGYGWESTYTVSRSKS